MKTPSTTTTTAMVYGLAVFGLAVSGLALSLPATGRASKTIGTRTDWMLKCSHGSCYSMVGCTSDGAVTHNEPSCWQMCTCVAPNSTVVVPGR